MCLLYMATEPLDRGTGDVVDLAPLPLAEHDILGLKRKLSYITTDQLTTDFPVKTYLKWFYV